MDTSRKWILAAAAVLCAVAPARAALEDDGRSLVARQVLQITEEVECVVVLEGS